MTPLSSWPTLASTNSPHGHCGVLRADGVVDNDRTLESYVAMAIAQAEAGAHVVAPSGMMDGQVAAIRQGLDAAGHLDTAILAYSAKYASAFYGPFREAVTSSLEGDRKTYQQDPANRREGLREALLDLAEGADIVMVKPAGYYLDVLSDVAAVASVPVAAYQVSGEFAMIEAAAQRGWIDREPAIRESVTAIVRAGADIVLTYWAEEWERGCGERIAVRAGQGHHPRGRLVASAGLRVRGRRPVFVAEAAGPYIVGQDGRRYVDLVCSWGPALLGHAHPEVVEAVQQAAARGLSFSAPTLAEVELAEAISARVPVAEKVRFVSTGTEATMTALRLARGATGRDLIVKFAGCYHGHSDGLLAAAGSGVATQGLPGSAGVTPAAAADTIVVDYNDLPALEAVFANHGDRIAAVITEAAPANMGVVPPAPGFNEAIRMLTQRHGSLMILDEVLTGFRVGPSGWLGLEGGYEPDIIAFGKVVGGGCRWPPSVGGPTSCNSWLPLGPSTRPARCQATRWPRLPGSPPSGSPTQRSMPTSTDGPRSCRRPCPTP